MEDQAYEKFLEYYKTKDLKLRNELVEENLYIVDILVRKYLYKGVDYDDLHQVGSLALILSVERFDPTKGFSFSSFATPTILGEIKKYFRDKEWTLKVPRRLKELSGKISSAKEELYSKLNRDPSVAELSGHTGIPEDEIVQALESGMGYRASSLDQTYNDLRDSGEGLVLDKFIAVEEKGFLSVEYSEIIEKVLSEMSEKNKYIFRKRFLEEKTQMEISEYLGVSQMTVSRAEKNIVEKFKHALRGGEDIRI